MKNLLIKIFNNLKLHYKNNNYKNPNAPVKNDYSYISFILKLIKIFPFTTIISIPSILLMYLYSIKLFAMSDIFLIDKNYFTEEAFELKIWDGLFIFTHSFFSVNLLLLILFSISLFITVTLPMYLGSMLLNNTNTEKYKIISTIRNTFGIVFISIVLFIFSLLSLLKTSALISSSIQKEFIDKTHFCEVLLSENNKIKSIVILEKPSIPYKLVFTKSKLFYVQPNQESAIWREYSNDELSNMESSLCSDYKTK